MATKIYSSATGKLVRRRIYVTDKLVTAFIELGETRKDAFLKVNRMGKEIKFKSQLKFMSV